MAIAILGYGATGQSIAKHFDKIGQEYRIYDDYREDYCNISEYMHHIGSPAYVSPGIPINKVSHIPQGDIYTDIDIFLNHFRGTNVKLIGVTGTCGKSYVCYTLEHNLNIMNKRAQIVGNMNLPVLNYIDYDCDIFIVELSSMQLHYTNSLSGFHICCLTNIYQYSPHVDEHGSFHSYFLSKQRLFNESNGIHIINVDNDISMHIMDKSRNKSEVHQAIAVSNTKILYSGYSVLNGLIYFNGERVYKNVIGNPNDHIILSCLNALNCNVQNYYHMATMEHRGNVIYRIGSLSIINNSKATNLHAWLHNALLYNGSILISGGQDTDSGSLSKFVNAITHDDRNALAKNIAHIVCTGENRSSISQIFRQIGMNTSVHANMHYAVSAAIDFAMHSAANYVILLPGFQSFDLYKNFEERGLDFTNIVNAISQDMLKGAI